MSESGIAEAYAQIRPAGGDTATSLNLEKRLRVITRHAPLDQGQVLDCGCGAGEYVRALRRRGAGVWGIEFSLEKLKTSRRDVAGRLTQGDLGSMAIRDSTIDTVLLNEVLEHVPDDRQVLGEVYRVLRPGGTLVMFSPNRRYPFETHGVSLKRSGRRVPHYVPFVPYLPLGIASRVLEFWARNYWPGELRRLVLDAGFTVAPADYVWQTFEGISSNQPKLVGHLAPVLRVLANVLERVPFVRSFGASQVIVARKPTQGRLPTASPAAEAIPEASRKTDVKVLNLGCGVKTSSDPRVVNLDWSMYLVIKSNRVLSWLSRYFLSDVRLARLKQLPDSIVVHDLRKGIPFDAESVDAVYHSHFLEHLDRPNARLFLSEVHRVLKPGGIQRIVVPDLERLCADYLVHVRTSLADAREAESHDDFVAGIIEQAVRRESVGATEQSPVRRVIDRMILGDARKRGETHQWMYDRVNLPSLLKSVGYRSVNIERYDTSRIPDWNRFGLDRDEQGGEYKTESLYVEAIK
jgi:ubiquinone/menaquinone biosynthesis C-methylase UbiE